MRTKFCKILLTFALFKLFSLLINLIVTWSFVKKDILKEYVELIQRGYSIEQN